jgi:outer membrane protein assembly factor BamA
MTVDTRVDPLLPRNAVHATATVERIGFSTMQATRTDVDASAYIGLYGGSVLVLRAVREHFNRPVPAYFKSILGGSRNLRGFRAGTAIGDTIVAGSAEVRVPLTSPLHLAAFGTSVFLDAGAAYDNGYHLKDQTFMKGIGAGVWMTAPLFRLSLMVAHGIGAGTRAHFGAGLTF